MVMRVVNNIMKRIKKNKEQMKIRKNNFSRIKKKKIKKNYK